MQKDTYSIRASGLLIGELSGLGFLTVVGSVANWSWKLGSIGWKARVGVG